MFKKFFTLLEMITVVTILAILALIVFFGIKDHKKDATRSRILGNIRNIQTAVDIYSYENGSLPVKVEPDYENPSQIDFSLLYPKYLKSIPKLNGNLPEYYWVDVFGQVWGSTVDLVHNASYVDGKILWGKHDDRITAFTVYELEDIKKGRITDFTKRYKEILSSLFMKDKKYVQIIPEENKKYLVSVTDDLDLPTPPASPFILPASPLTEKGETLPIGTPGTFYFTVNAGGLAKWINYTKTEIKPEGTNIIYEFATSDDRNNWTDYITDFSKLSNSQYLRIKVTLTPNAKGESPTLKYLHVKFERLDKNDNVEPTQKNIQVIDPKKTCEQQPEGCAKPDPNPNPTPTPEKKEWEDVGELTFDTDAGKDVDWVRIEKTEYIPANTRILYSYYYKTDNSPNWAPTGSIETAPNSRYFMMVAKLQRIKGTEAVPNVTNVKFIYKDITEKPIPVPPKKWVEIDRKEFVTDAQKVVDWISITKDDEVNEFTRIEYLLYYSNDGSNYIPVNSIETAPNSRYFKVVAVLKKLEDYNESPANGLPRVNSVVVNYKDIIQPEGGENISWVKIDDLIFTKDGKEGYEDDTSWDGVVDWIAVEKEEDKPEGTFISYQYCYSNNINSTNWGCKESVSNVPNSRYLKVVASRYRRSDINNEPKILNINFIYQRPIKYDPEYIGWEIIDEMDYTTDAGKVVDWLSITKDETIPTGTKIVYKLYYSNDVNLKNWTEVNSISNAPNSRFFKVHVIRMRQIGITDEPTVRDLKVNYQDVAEWELIDTKDYVENPGRVVDWLSVTKTENIPQDTKVEYKYYYTDDETLNNWTSVSSVSSAPNSKAFKVQVLRYKLTTTTNVPTVTNVVINYKDIEEWITIDDLTFVTDATDIGDWISVEKEETKPEGTNIEYKYYYSNVENSWTLSGDDITKVPDSRFLKIVATRKRLKNITATPTINSLTVNYDLNGTTMTCPVEQNRTIKWKNMNCYVFDNDDNTYQTVNLKPNHYIDVSWDGNLENKVVDLKTYIPTSRVVLQVLDSNKNTLSFIDYNSGNFVEALNYQGENYYKIIIPTGAKYIRFFNQSTEISYPIEFYKIRETADLVSPNPVTNVTYTSTINSITLNWTNPSVDFDKVAIYKNGIFKAYVTENTYTDSPLYDNTTYNYDLIVFDNAGNISNKYSISIKTEKNIITWNGLSPEAFDDDDYTYTFQNLGRYGSYSSYTDISWSGNLENKVVELKTYIPSSDVILQVLDSSKKPLNFIDYNSGNNVASLSYQGEKTYKIVIPTAGKYLRFYYQPLTNYTTIKVYKIRETSDLVSPEQVSNVNYTSTINTITLNWTNPSTDFDKVAIYRNGVFVTYTTGTTYTDGLFYDDTTYNYDLIVFDGTGNISNKYSLTAKTQKNVISWRGLTPEAFDDDDYTYTSKSLGRYGSYLAYTDITWDNNLENKAVELKTYIPSSSVILQIIDSLGKPVTFIDYNSGNYVTSLSYQGEKTYKIIIPTGAKRIRFYYQPLTNFTTIKVYKIRETSDLVSPDPVSNITYNSTSNSITLNWTNPSSDFDKVAIYRNGVFKAYTIGTTYTDSGLTSQTTYTYEFITFDASGNASTKQELTVTTQ